MNVVPKFKTIHNEYASKMNIIMVSFVIQKACKESHDNLKLI